MEDTSVKRRKQVRRKDVRNFKTLPAWELQFRFITNLINTIRDVPVVMIGYLQNLNTSVVPDEDIHINLLVRSCFDGDAVTEETYYRYFSDFIHEQFAEENPDHDIVYHVSILNDEEKTGQFMDTDINSVYSIPVYMKQNQRLIGAAMFFTTLGEEELFHNERITSHLSAAANAAIYAIGFEGQSLIMEEKNQALNRSLKAEAESRDQLNIVLERRKRLLEITNHFRSITKMGELFRQAAIELGQLINCNDLEVKLFFQTRCEFYTEVHLKDGQKQPIENRPTVKLLDLLDANVSELENPRLNQRNLRRIYSLVRQTRNPFVLSNENRKLPVGIFPFRSGEEVDGVLVLNQLSSGKCLTPAEQNLGESFAQILGNTLLRLRSERLARQEETDRQFILEYSINLIRAMSEKTGLKEMLHYVIRMGRTLSVSSARKSGLTSGGIHGGIVRIEKESDQVMIEATDDAHEPLVMSCKEYEEFKQKYQDDQGIIRVECCTQAERKQFVADYPVFRGANFPMVILPMEIAGEELGYFWLQGDRLLCDMLKQSQSTELTGRDTITETGVRPPTLFEYLTEFAWNVIEFYRLQAEEAEKKTIESQLKVAHALQQSFLPKHPDRQKVLNFDAYSDPSKEIGGDYYDIISYENGCIGIIMADVSGKGPAAALVTVMIKTLFKFNAPRFGDDIASLIKTVNESMVEELDIYSFVTLSYLYIKPTGQIKVVNCGHNETFVYRGASTNKPSLELIGSDHPPVGVLSGLEFPDKTFEISEKDVIMLFTDGIVEGVDRKGNMYGMERLQESFTCNATIGVKKCLKVVREDFNRFRQNTPLRDDASIAIFSLKGN